MNKAERTKDLILEKSIELFRFLGYEKTTIDDICKNCGIVKGTFYRYFKGKEDILQEYHNNILIRDFNIIDILLDSDDPRQCLIQLAVETLFYNKLFGPELFGQLFVISFKNSNFKDSVAFSAPELDDIYLKLINRCQRHGLISAENTPEDIYELIKLVNVGLAIKWINSNGEIDYEKETRKAMEMILR